MKPDLVRLLCCPSCADDLTLATPGTVDGQVHEGALVCRGCTASYPIVRGIPRFVESDGYVGSFSYEWNRWNRVQLDVANGRTESEDTFIEKTGLRPEDLRGKLVLDVGCGAGRFLDIASRWGARVVGIDYSFAVEASQTNVGSRDNVDVLQADVFRLPFKPEIFDVIFSIGVLHHTRDTREAFLRLPPLLKNGGTIAVWLYYYTDPVYRAASDFWRAIFSRVPNGLAYAWCWLLVTLFAPLYTSALMKKAPFWHLPRVLPVNTHEDFRWRVLDTFDWWTPRYQDKDCSPTRVLGWFQEAGLRDAEILDYPTAMRARRDDAGQLPVLHDSLPALEGARYVVFGAGAGGEHALRTLEAFGLAAQVVAVCDNAPAKAGTPFHGHTIRPFASLAREDYDFVIIASLPGRAAIARQLNDAGLVERRQFGTVEFIADLALPVTRLLAA
ncbi:MAG: methyltransferase domain-containing protein [Vicinamibacterales bacterium]|nr:methyltransferase domain-containing protein [Vicinamibacterales bacterium]